MSEYSAKDIARFEAKFTRGGPKECWNWRGSTNGKRGYGKILFNGRLVLAHRFSYELTNGPIPSGATIDHLCNVRTCVNPDHLAAVSQRANNMRGNSPTAINHRKTHCAHGHLLAGENLIVTIRNGSNRRKCRTCDVIYKRKARCAKKQ